MNRKTVFGLGLILALVIVRHHWALGISWINDDFLFLERARDSGFFSSLNFNDALGNAYRPVARNVYYWLGWRVFGVSPLGYHIVNLGIACSALVLLYLVFRRMILDVVAREEPRKKSMKAKSTFPPDPSGLVLLGVLLFAVHPAAATPLSWIAGIQDLLAVTLGLAAMLAFLHGQRFLYALLFTAALLSKETVFLLPLVLWLYDTLCKKTSWKAATAHQAVVLVPMLAWLIFNPFLPWNSSAAADAAAAGGSSVLSKLDPGPLWTGVQSLLLVEPRNAFEWPHSLWVSVVMIVLAGSALFFAVTGKSPPRLSGSLLVIAAAWSLSGLLPLIAAKGTCVYYAYYPALGLSLGLMVVLAPMLAGRSLATGAFGMGLAAVLVGLGLMGDGFKHDRDMCDAHNMRRSSRHLWNFKTDLQTMHPSFPDSSRCYFWSIPFNIGFQLADGPALRLWYDNKTLEGHYWSKYEYHPSRPSFFFGHDDKEHLFELLTGYPDPYLEGGELAYADGHNDLGLLLARQGNVPAAMVEWRKSLQVMPDHVLATGNLGTALIEHGRPGEGVVLLERVVRGSSPHAEAYYYLAKGFYNLGEYARAQYYLGLYRDTGTDASLEVEAGQLGTLIDQALE